METHRYTVYCKWKVPTRSELPFKAVKLGLVKEPCGRGRGGDGLSSLQSMEPAGVWKD